MKEKIAEKTIENRKKNKGRKAYVFLSGELKGSREYYRNLIGESPVYCGDGGANLVHEIGIIPKEIWGDMDSIDLQILDDFRKSGTKIEKFDAEKDLTDGELILEYVSSKSYKEICVIGALGGRMDHTLTNTNLLFKYRETKFLTELEEIFSIEKEKLLNYPVGTVVSFVPFTDMVKGLTLEGFKYPLKNFTLKRGDSICMSNILESAGMVKFESGEILCIVQNSEEKFRK